MFRSNSVALVCGGGSGGTDGGSGNGTFVLFVSKTRPAAGSGKSFSSWLPHKAGGSRTQEPHDLPWVPCDSTPTCRMGAIGLQERTP